MYTVYAERYNKYEPIIDSKTKEVIDDGAPKKVRLCSWDDEARAKIFADNVKASVPKRSWKVWIES